MPHRPLIAITLDSRVEPAGSTSPRTYHTGSGYADAVADAGGAPILIGHHGDALDRVLDLADGFIFTGGGDPDTTAFGEATHPEARVVDPRRQAFELALLDRLDRPPHADTPVLGVCLGMQLMALRGGAKLDQAMWESMGDDAAAAHAGFQPHRVTVTAEAPMLPPPPFAGETVSSHRQRITDPGSLTAAARADDGTIEAVWDAARPWRLGVQWHAERTRDADTPLGWGLIRRLVEAAGRSRRAD